MAAQHGLIRRRQALEAGLSVDELRRLLRAGRWIPVRRGVYADGQHWAELDEWTGRPLLEVHAAHLSLRCPHVMSHESAALLQGLSVLRGDLPLVHVTLQAGTGARTEYAIKHHIAPFRDEQVIVAQGIPCLEPARTAADIAREHGRDRGVVACDAVLRLGKETKDLVAVRTQMRNWPGVTAVDEAIELADAGAESVGESLARCLVHDSGIGRPQTQFEVSDGSRRAICDLRVDRHVIEFDGRVKYLDRSQGGVASQDPASALWEEKLRQDFVCGFKLGMSRLVWADFWGARRWPAIQRLRREYDDTVARFGTDTSDLPGAM
jgi:hypothetical protein